MTATTSLGALVEQMEAAVSAGDKAIGAWNSNVSGSDPSIMDAGVGVASALSALSNIAIAQGVGISAAGADFLKNYLELTQALNSGDQQAQLAAMMGTIGAAAAFSAFLLPPPYKPVAAAISIGATAAKAAILAADKPVVATIPPPNAGWWNPDLVDPKTLLPKVDPATNTTWTAAINWRPAGRDPLAIDLDGDGIETVGIGSNPVLFDHDANGVKTGTGWVKADDGWLVRDLDGNGTIDSGRELFGVDTLITTTQAVTDVNGSTVVTSTRYAETGFEALRALDADANGVADGVFDANDVAYAEVKIWQDLNQDGVSQAGELSTLASKGIANISLAHNSTTTDLGNGNSITGTAAVTRTDGSTTAVDSVGVNIDGAGNLTLANNPFYREFTDAIPLTAQALALPEMGGSGFVRDLRESMSMGTAEAGVLANAVQQFATGTTRDAQMAGLDAVVDAWAEASPHLKSIDTTASLLSSYSYNGFGFGNETPSAVEMFAEANPELYRKINALEQFNGQLILQNWLVPFILYQETYNERHELISRTPYIGGYNVVVPAGRAALVDEAYSTLRNSVYEGLVVQTRLKPYLDAIELNIDDSGVSFDTAGLTTKLAASHSTDARTALQDLVELVQYTNPTLQAVGFDGTPLLRSWLDELPPDSELRGMLNGLDTWWENTSNGTAREDIYLGDASANAFSAGDGDDVLNGFAGNDVLQGQQGRDTLLGGAGDDTLRGTIGWNNGQSNVDDVDVYDGGAGNDDIRDFEASNGDVYRLTLGGGQDTVQDDGGTGDRIDMDGGIGIGHVTVRNVNGQLIVSLASGERMTVLNAYSGEGALGNGAIEEIRFADGTVWDAAAIRLRASTGSAGADTMNGFDGADTMNGLTGNDAILGGAGNDVIDGGADNDYLSGERGNDTLLGGDGNDTLFGYVSWNNGHNEPGNSDTYDGGAGNDELRDLETSDSDVYRFKVGGGQDIVLDGGGVGDRIEVGAGLGTADATIRNVNGQLIVSLASGERMTVLNAYSGEGALGNGAIEEIRFADGTVWDAAAIRLRASTGSAGADTMNGFDGADTMNGLTGNDAILGGAGNDVIDGGADNDYLSGERGNDTLLGGEGNDTLFGQTSWNNGQNEAGNSDTYDGGAGNDYLEDNESSEGDVYRLNLGGGQDTVRDYGGAADRIEVGASIAATQLKLTNSGGSLLATIQGTTDSLTINNFFNGNAAASGAIEEIRFADGTVWNSATIIARATSAAPVLANPIADQSTSEDAAFTFQLPTNAFTDADAGQALSYAATLQDGSALPSWLAFDAATRSFSGTPGNANVGALQVKVTATDPLGLSASDVFALTVTNTNDAPTVATPVAAQTATQGQAFSLAVPVGTFADVDVGDTLTYSARLADGSALPAWLSFNAGTRSFSGTPSAAGTTSVRVTATDAAGLAISEVFDVVVASADKALTGTTGADTLAGGIGNDTLSGLAGNDSLTGAAGNDLLDGGAGNDTMVGGAGNDTYGVDSTADVVTEAANAGTDTVRSAVTWTLGSNVEHLVLTGTAAINGAGNTLANSLTGNSANNTLTGGAGNDTLDGRTGNDTMVGGAGNDTYVVNVATDVVTELANEGTDTIQSAVTLTLGSNLENLLLTGTTALNGTGNALDNWLTGNRAANTLTGGAGADTLAGGTSNDTLVGGAGADSYRFGRGWGIDTVQENDTAAGVKDLVVLQGSVTQADVSFAQSGNHLEMLIGATGDKLVFTNWYLGSPYHAEEFRFTDGSVLTDSQAQALVGAMAGFSATAADTSGGVSTSQVRVGTVDLASNAVL